MIEFKLKRLKGNRSVTCGRLSIPALNFECLTLELKDSAGMMFKQNCCIPLGAYQLVSGFDQRSAMYPVLKRRIPGYVKKPSLNIYDNDYLHLTTGDIALGVAMLDDFTLKQTDAFRDAFTELMRRAMLKGEIMTLVVYKSPHYKFEDKTFETRYAEHNNFVENEQEQTELDND